jgi:hypothetical protein
MIFCKELNKEFATKAEMFAELKANRDKIIGLKKAAIKNSDPVSFAVKGSSTIKATAEDSAPVAIGSHIYAIINCTNWLDSHGDVHLDGIWDQSVKDNKGKLYYIINHELELGKVISYPDEVVPSVQNLTWTDLGQPYAGNTQALMFDALLTEASNKDAATAIIAKKAIQNSVRMQYIDIILCIDDSSDDYKQEYANFYKYLAVIANKQDAMDAGYFWAVAQAKIVKEGSAVLFGSNEATPILYTDPGSTSQDNNKEEPAESSSVINRKVHTLFI